MKRMTDRATRIVLSGYLDAEPELHPDTDILRMLIAATFPKRPRCLKAAEEHVERYAVIVHGAEAIRLSRVLRQDSHIEVEGVLYTRAVVRDGETRYVSRVFVDRVKSLPSSTRSEPESRSTG